MKKRTLLKIFLRVFWLTLFSFTANLQAAPSNSKMTDKVTQLEQDLKNKYGDTSTVNHNTLAAPLLFSNMGVAGGLAEGVSLLGQPHTVGYEGDIAYQEIGDGFRLQYHNLNEEASFFWLFNQKMDLRNRWFRVRYSGLQVPSQIAMEFDHDEKRSDSRFDLYLEESITGNSVYFKLPDKLPFAEIETVRVVIRPDDLQNQNGDFLISSLELLPEGEDPLRGAPSDLARFDWYSNPFEANNQASFNTDLIF